MGLPFHSHGKDGDNKWIHQHGEDYVLECGSGNYMAQSLKKFKLKWGWDKDALWHHLFFIIGKMLNIIMKHVDKESKVQGIKVVGKEKKNKYFHNM
jgi:hypothetical protein